METLQRDRILAILREHQAELQAAGLLHLRLFGSIARGQNTSASDVDFLADFDRAQPLTLMTLSGMQSQLEDLLGIEADLTSAEWLFPAIKSRALAEAILVF